MRTVRETFVGERVFDWLVDSPPVREAGRVLMLDERSRAFLVESRDFVDGPTFLHVVGGGIEPGETPSVAALREAVEETGYLLDPAGLVGPLARREILFDFPRARPARAVLQIEHYFAARVGEGDPSRPPVPTDLERLLGDRGAWMTRAEVTAFAAARDAAARTVFPLDLFELWDDAEAALR